MTGTDNSESQARLQLACIREMVAALECDYDRLEQLRDERDGWECNQPDDDYPVRVLDDDDEAESRATCGECERSWDDAIVTSMTPAPAGRCPFEHLHSITWESNNPDDADELKELTEAAGDCESREEAEQRIKEDALSVEVRGDWYEPGSDPPKPSEFTILLCTGGPACRIMGELDDNGEPYRAWLEHQDWGTPWTHYHEEGAQETLLAYARCFFFGE